MIPLPWNTVTGMTGRDLSVKSFMQSGRTAESDLRNPTKVSLSPSRAAAGTRLIAFRLSDKRIELQPQKNSVPVNTTDTGETIEGEWNDTATPQNTVFEGRNSFHNPTLPNPYNHRRVKRDSVFPSHGILADDIMTGLFFSQHLEL